MPTNANVKLVKKEQLKEDIFKFTCESKEISNNAKPGQFVEIKISESYEPFLRRPISIYNVNKQDNLFEIIFQVKGRGTNFLSKLEEGDFIDVVGPLGNGIFNGELGIIEKINKEDKTIKVKFDDGKVAVYENSDLDQLEHAYAITVHKSQGSEFDVVILAISQSAPMLLTRNLLYTGMTRAKKLLIVIGTQNILNYMLQNNTTRQRNTGLKYKLEQLQ